MNLLSKSIINLNLEKEKRNQNQMGIVTSKLNRRKPLKNSIITNWELVETTKNQNIYKHKIDGRQGEQYTYKLDDHYDAQNEGNIFDFRNKTTQPLVRVWQYQYENKGKKMISLNFFRVITQRIPYKLSQFPQLSFNQCLYILDRCLDGFSSLYRHVGPFDLNSDMIGFTSKGEVRVWFNQKFGSNYPSHQKGTLQATRIDQTYQYDHQYIQIEEVQIVRKINSILQDKCEDGMFPQIFKAKILQRIGFNQAKRIVSEQLSNPKRIRLNHIDLLRNSIQQKNVILRTDIGLYDKFADSLKSMKSNIPNERKYNVVSIPIESQRSRQFN